MSEPIIRGGVRPWRPNPMLCAPGSAMLCAPGSARDDAASVLVSAEAVEREVERLSGCTSFVLGVGSQESSDG